MGAVYVCMMGTILTGCGKEASPASESADSGIKTNIQSVLGNPEDEETNNSSNVSATEQSAQTETSSVLEAAETAEEHDPDDVLNGDFTFFAGTYKARDEDNDGYGGGEALEDLVLHEDGTITGGGASYQPQFYPETAPISVTKQKDGSYECKVTDYADGVGNTFYIYPVGVAGDEAESEPFLKDTVYIQYVQEDGGVMDIIYYKDDSSDDVKVQNSSGKVFTTKASDMPTFTMQYPENWSIENQEIEKGSEYDVLSNGKGLTITYESSDEGFGGQYYGGDKTLYSVHITKVADASFSPKDWKGKSYSSLGKFVVAKITEYAMEDGETGESSEYDGGSYYALLPESSLGDNDYVGMGYWEMSSWDYVKSIVLMAESESGEFTAEEEKEVVYMLASFAVK